MDVGPVGSGLPPADAAAALGRVVAASVDGLGQEIAAQLLDSASLPDLTPPDVTQLLRVLETLPETSVDHLPTVARLDAESRLTEAARLVEGMPRLPGWEASPQVLLRIVHQLFDSGHHAGYVRAAGLAQALIDAAGPSQPGTTYFPILTLPVAEPVDSALNARLSSVRTWEKPPRRLRPILRAMWRRAPLLVLLFSWLGIGLLFGLASVGLRSLLPAVGIDAGFAIWALGFLVVVAFGFYLQVRDIKIP